MYPNKIINNIWLGGVIFDNNDGDKFIKNNNINCIVSVMKEIPDFVKSLYDTYSHYQIKIDDVEVDIFPYLEDFLEYMDEQMKDNKNIYIHCQSGQSRSVAFCIAYLMYKEKIYDVDHILNNIKKQRNCIYPSSTFLFSLEIFAKWLKLNKKYDLLCFRREYIENMKNFINYTKYWNM